MDIRLTNILPISKAANHLAGLIKKVREQQEPIVITQKGYPMGVLLDIDTYQRLAAQAKGKQNEPY
jgi:prevent-host-death family protein